MFIGISVGGDEGGVSPKCPPSPSSDHGGVEGTDMEKPRKVRHEKIDKGNR